MQKCRMYQMGDKIKVKVVGRERVSTDEEEIAAYIAQNGPVSVALNADAMMSYTGRNFTVQPHMDAGDTVSLIHLLEIKKLNLTILTLGGISHPWSFMCASYGIDHAVLMTGYGVDNGTPFWNIKNSWGPGWGEGGFYR